MLNVKTSSSSGKSVIMLTRGDSAYLTITPLTPDDDTYELQNGDEIIASVRTKPNTGTLLFQSTSDDGIEFDGDTIYWHIKPKNTKGTTVGTYYYDVQLKIGATGDIFTFIPSSKFIITDEVTYDE